MRATSSAARKTLQTSWGPIAYQDTGTGRPILFLHGILVNGSLWDHVATRLADEFRLIRPDLPLGGHRHAAPRDADLSLPSLAGLVLEIIERLDLDDLTLVGNDTGGALCQVVITRDDPRTARIGRVCLTNCDAFETFPPAALALLRAVALPAPTFLGWTTARLTKTRLGRRILFLTAAYSKRPDAEMVALLGGFNDDAAIRRDAVKVLTEMQPRHTLDAAARFVSFDRPVHLVWGLNDFFFPISLGERLQRAFPRATLQQVPDARLYIPLDQPDTVAEALLRFVQTTSASRAKPYRRAAS